MGQNRLFKTFCYILLIGALLAVLQYTVFIPELKTFHQRSGPSRVLLETVLREGHMKEDGIYINRHFLAEGFHISRQILQGSVFEESGHQKMFAKHIVTSVVHSFSPSTETRVMNMFQDGVHENKYRPLGPAILERNGSVHVVQRIWLSQYEENKHAQSPKQLINTFQENYLYEETLDENYRSISTAGKIMLIPAPSNAMFSYRSDGPMDPRLVEISGKMFVTFHIWANEDEQLKNRGRTHIWDHEEKIIKKLKIDNHEEMTGEINWVPFEFNNALHFVYTFDPFAVIKCDTDSGHCRFVQHKQYGNSSFHYTKDHLRGGTPFVKYSYPYYISVAHSTTIVKDNSHVYNAHFVVMSSKPTFRIVYVSAPIQFDATLLDSIEIVRNYSISQSFVFPVGITVKSYDVIDIGAHVNDCTSFIFRISGVRNLMLKVIKSDKRLDTKLGPPERVIQKQVGNWVKLKFPELQFKDV